VATPSVSQLSIGLKLVEVLEPEGVNGRQRVRVGFVAPDGGLHIAILHFWQDGLGWQWRVEDTHTIQLPLGVDGEQATYQ